MYYLHKNYLFALLIGVIGFSSCQDDNHKADTILTNGVIFTMNATNDSAQAIAIKGHRILSVGSNNEIEKFKSPLTKVYDLQGKLVLPGFTDAHIHPIGGGLALNECPLTDIKTEKEIIDSIKKYSINHPDKKWIIGENMWLAAFKGGNPLKEALDSILPDRPAYITSMDGHNAWVNTKALQIANVSKETPDPINGKIERQIGSKIPSGTLRESAMRLVRQHIPDPSADERKQALIKAIELANMYGITTLNEASAGKEYIDTYYQLEKDGKLHAHINISIYCDISKGIQDAYRVIRIRDSLQKINSTIHANQVKLFMDGVVEGKTAAMIDNYSDDHHKGSANAPYDTALSVIKTMDKAGLQIHTHAIGDQAIRMTLDGYEQALKANGNRDSRHHIAHLQVIHPDDIPRFKALHVIANFQALWATWEDSYMTELNQPFLGPERMEWQYPIGTLHKTGATLAFGSDWDVSTQNPFYALQVAVNRRGPDSIDRTPWTPQHLIDRYSVIKGYTANGAYLTFRETETGTIEADKYADIIVLDQNIFTCDAFRIYKTNVVRTFFKGKVVYERE